MDRIKLKREYEGGEFYGYTSEGHRFGVWKDGQGYVLVDYGRTKDVERRPGFVVNEHVSGWAGSLKVARRILAHWVTSYSPNCSYGT